jgi:cysteine desulfurase / selenocysteine lyase
MSSLRSQFPILQTKLNDHDLIYLDSAATTQKPQVVIDSIVYYYTNLNASSHSPHTLGVNVTEQIEQTRSTVAGFINTDSSQIVFTSGATESVNLVANGFLESSVGSDHSNLFYLDEDSEILICVDQHHSNILPWQRLSNIIGCRIVFFGIHTNGQWDLEDFESKLNPNTKIVTMSNVSNVVGVVQDVRKMNKILNQTNFPRPFIVLDATQAVAHFSIDVVELDCDFVVFSGHKVFGPTGVGVLYGRSELLEVLPNYKVGGDMVETVSMDGNIYKESPYRFEAGTGNFAGIIGLGKAIKWTIANQTNITDIELKLTNHLYDQLLTIPNISIIADNQHQNLENKIPLFSFTIANVNPLDLALLCDQQGICIRSGQHCAGILHEAFDLNSSCRISLACYNTTEEITKTIDLIKKIAATL